MHLEAMGKLIKYKDIVGYYKDEGSGPSLMLLHGFGMDGSIWDGIVKDLKKDFRVLIPDLPGIRHSGLSKEPLTMEWFADFIKAIAEEEGLKMFHLFGHSMGGYIALAFAERYPEMLQKFGLFHSNPLADSQEKIKSRER